MRGPDIVAVEFMVDAGGGRAADLLGNDRADAAADMGRLRQRRDLLKV